MQNIILYVNAENTLGVVRDYANAVNRTAPILTKGVSARLKFRLFRSGMDTDPYPMEELRNIAAWQFVMDDDFDPESRYILIADHAGIEVNGITETINETECTFSEISVPIPAMNTVELNEVLGTDESISSLNGELIGFDSNGKEAFVLQIKGFTVRNRISSCDDPTELPPDYFTEAQVRALIAAKDADIQRIGDRISVIEQQLQNMNVNPDQSLE